MKSISLISKHSDCTAAEFQRYYEDMHCWLAMRHFPFIRYTRNYLVNAAAAVDFDCISEFGLQPDFRGGDTMRSGSREMMLEDELKFMNPAQIRVAQVREQTLLGTADETVGLTRYLLLFAEQEGQDIEQESKAVLDGLPAVRHASLDWCEPRAGSTFPYVALLWLTIEEGSAKLLPQPGELAGLSAVLKMTTHATPPATLRERFEVYLA